MDAPRVPYKTGFQYWGESSSEIIRTCRVCPKQIMPRHSKRSGSRWVAISTWKSAVLVVSPTSEKEGKKETTTSQNAKQNQKSQQNKNQTTTPKTANKGTVANAALLITSLQTHPKYVLFFYALAIKVYAGLQEETTWRSGDGSVRCYHVLVFFL